MDKVISDDERRAALDAKIAEIERREKFELFTRNNYEAKLRSTYRWSVLRFMLIGFFTLGIGVFLYPIYFAARKATAMNLFVYLSVNERGEVHRSFTKDASPLR